MPELQNVTPQTGSRTLREPSAADNLIAHILDLTTSSPSLLDSLREIRSNQQVHEQTWFKARSIIAEKYQKKRQVNDMLLAIGGTAGLSEEEITEQETKELALFDGKLRMAMGQMYLSQVQELKALGIKALSNHDDMRRVYNVIEELLE